MTKNDVIRSVQKSIPYYPPHDLARAVNIIFNGMADALNRNERIEIRGLGSFTVKSRMAHTGRNPKSGKVFSVPIRKAPYFKAAKELLRMING
jgi:integration host factor subunit beta